VHNKVGAILFSAGYGSRLGHRTIDTPKVLLPIKGEPILKIWIDKLMNIDASMILVNTHYLSEKINKFILNNYNNSVKLKTVHEPELLGTGGSLLEYITMFSEFKTILFIHTDNYSDINLRDFLECHLNRPKKAKYTMGIFQPLNFAGCGMLEVSSDGMATTYEEKPLSTKYEWANAGVFASDVSEILSLKNLNLGISDFSRDFIPSNIREFYTYKINGIHIDIGTESNYLLANNYRNT
jgi:mannose-1-phosphate guanylyltransferase